MATATYYAKIWYGKELSYEELIEKKNQVSVFFDQVRQANKFWQKHFVLKDGDKLFLPGIHDHNGESSPQWSDKFWSQFQELYPTAYGYLQTLSEIYSNNDEKNDEERNLLNSILGKGYIADVLFTIGSEIDILHGFQIDIDERCVMYAADVLHWCSWMKILDFACKLTGGDEWNYISDEYSDLFDCVTRTQL